MLKRQLTSKASSLSIIQLFQAIPRNICDFVGGEYMDTIQQQEILVDDEEIDMVNGSGKQRLSRVTSRGGRKFMNKNDEDNSSIEQKESIQQQKVLRLDECRNKIDTEHFFLRSCLATEFYAYSCCDLEEEDNSDNFKFVRKYTLTVGADEIQAADVQRLLSTSSTFKANESLAIHAFSLCPFAVTVSSNVDNISMLQACFEVFLSQNFIRHS